MKPQKRKNEPIAIEKPPQKGCLAQVLALNFFVIAYTIIQSIWDVSTFSQYESLIINADEIRLKVYALLILTIIMLGCAIGLAKWKHWAFYGTILSTVIYVMVLVTYNNTTCTSFFIGWAFILVLALLPNRKHFT